MLFSSWKQDGSYLGFRSGKVGQSILGCPVYVASVVTTELNWELGFHLLHLPLDTPPSFLTPSLGVCEFYDEGTQLPPSTTLQALRKTMEGTSVY